ncbi:hypothetical protein [uncultured Bacteroides sp.]|uniref:hypothetical protein n=1 Tax=uncultured Bacteroides sp. TaxID=162156 RepID=UPI002AAB885A|nr:hypothetical protein [uncultured Bacteroides sp.]
MNDTLMTAIIAAGSALLGGAIPSIINYFSISKQKNIELNSKLKEQQKDLYLKYLLVLQKGINEMTNENFLELQNINLEIALYGDDKTSKLANQYYTTLVNQSNNNIPMDPESHKEFQSKIFNAMRKHLKLDTYEEFYIIGYNPN